MNPLYKAVLKGAEGCTSCISEAILSADIVHAPDEVRSRWALAWPVVDSQEGEEAGRQFSQWRNRQTERSQSD